MIEWPTKPVIYEINTWVWLNTLSRTYNWPVTLDNVPDRIVDDIASLGIDAIWLMGVWMRSPAALASARKYAGEYKSALPDLTADDIIGSPYAVAAYLVDENLGGKRGLAAFRARLRERGIRLILDFVPNHIATDHAWLRIHPDFLVLGTPQDLRKRADTFYGGRDATGQSIVVAHGRDPHFPGWIDTAQVNAFSVAARRAILSTLLDIADQCDGVRCDMAMLLLNDVFARTWQGYVGSPPEQDFWPEIIPKVKAEQPDFLFIGEVYWDLEFKLQQQGFDFTYDKRLYDRIMDCNVPEIHNHLNAPLDFQKHMIRFVENHDEQRVTDVLGPDGACSAAALVCTLPGVTLLHDGQISGKRVKLPVQVGRQPFEPPNQEIEAFYRKLLREIRSPIYQTGEWRLFDTAPAKKNGTHENLLSYGWRNGENNYRLIVVNLTDEQSQAHIDLDAWPGIEAHDWELHDELNGHTYYRQGQQMDGLGLYVDLPPHKAHIFRFEQLS
jgi:glycosidase